MCSPRRLVVLALSVILVAGIARSVRAAADTPLERLATCQDSWFDWKDNPGAAARFGDSFRAAFSGPARDGSWTPKSPTQMLGLSVLQVFPQSVGMGVGFSVVVAASFDEARAAVEKSVGKPLKGCDASDGMRTCDLTIAEKRTVMVMSGLDPQPRRAMLGCYYFYEK